MENNYFFIDGSSLLSDIKKVKSDNSEYKGKLFDIVDFSNSFFNSYELRKYHSGTYRRIVFYFVKNDSRVNTYLQVPDFKKPGIVNDMQIKYCGKRIPVYKKAEDWLNSKKAPNYVTDSLYKSEKAVDSQICCDALTLLSLNKLDRLFLYTNDYDFVPLCQSIKTLGANINLIRLKETRVNKDLVEEFDAFNTFSKNQIDSFFGIKK